MSVKAAATDLVRTALGAHLPFLVLRGLDDCAREDGDIDVLVPRNHANEALKLVGEMAHGNGWAVAGLRNIGYLSQICLAKRWGDGARHHAVKIDFFNGLSWAALGADPLGAILFENLKENGESETVGLTTLLQKLLYAGYLRDRDRARISAACDLERIAAFIEATGIPLTRADLERGKLGKMARWRLRAASAGVAPTGLPVWMATVAWRRLVFAAVRSSSAGAVFVVSGADASRRAALVGRFRSLLRQSGFPEPAIGAAAAPTTTPWFRAAACIWWQAFRGETVLVDAASLGPLSLPARATGLLATAVPVHLPEATSLAAGDGAQDGNDDLDVLLASVSKQALHTLRGTRTP